MENKMINKLIEKTSKRLEQSILDFNPKAIDFKFEFDIKDNLIFIIGYSKVENNYGGWGGWAIYRMECIDVYDGVIFKDGNVIDYDSMYNTSEVIKKTKGYFSHYTKKLSSI